MNLDHFSFALGQMYDARQDAGGTVRLRFEDGVTYTLAEACHISGELPADIKALHAIKKLFDGVIQTPAGRLGPPERTYPPDRDALIDSIFADLERNQAKGMKRKRARNDFECSL